jgi:beta-lactamase superfamily II metal-dependent hydrolase
MPWLLPGALRYARAASRQPSLLFIAGAMACGGVVFDGIEIDMLGIGDSDCLLVSFWNGLSATRVLIDGGDAGDYWRVRSFLYARGVTHLNAVIVTHLHDRHSAGLLPLINDRSVTIDKAFVPVPQDHLQMSLVEEALKTAAGTTEAAAIEKSLQNSAKLIKALDARGIIISEPFQGNLVESLVIVGPSQEYYEELIRHFEDADAIKAVDQANVSQSVAQTIDDYLVEKNLNDPVLLENPQTTPENNSSVILGTIFGDDKYLFTSDSGVPALKHAIAAFDLKNLCWMQIPHHGSRRNISAELIDHFTPAGAWLSAASDTKHRQLAVVNAFKKVGAQVFNTHHPTEGNLWRHDGNVPPRKSYQPATPIYKKDGKAAAASA